LSTPRLSVIGDPIGHSKSPQIHAQFAQDTGISLDYTKTLVTASELEDYLQQFFAAGGTGLNVTVPHKEAVWRWCQHLTERAQAAGAVNTLYRDGDRIVGDNTDGAGLVDDLLRQGVVLTDTRVLLLGAGGAARGALLPLVQAGARVTLYNRTEQRARQLIEDLGAGRLLRPDDASFDLVISASSAGLIADSVKLPQAWFHAQTFAYDMIYSDQETAFMQAARQAGAGACSDGLGMLVGQAARAFQRWFGVLPPTKAVFDQLRKD